MVLLILQRKERRLTKTSTSQAAQILRWPAVGVYPGLHGAKRKKKKRQDTAGSQPLFSVDKTVQTEAKLQTLPNCSAFCGHKSIDVFDAQANGGVKSGNLQLVVRSTESSPHQLVKLKRIEKHTANSWSWPSN